MYLLFTRRWVKMLNKADAGPALSAVYNLVREQALQCPARATVVRARCVP